MSKTKEYEINIRHEDNGDFYIMVVDPDGSFLYDGYWENDGATFEDAMKEALSGSGLEE